MKKLLLLPIVMLSFSLKAQNSAYLIPQDKCLHFIAGAGISAISYTTVNLITKDKKKAFWIGLASGILAGAIKETIDSTKPHNYWDKNDFLATSLGALSVSVVLRIN